MSPDHFGIETPHIAGRRRSVTIPAQGISAVQFDHLHRLDDIAFALAHLFALGIEDMPQANTVLVAGTVE